MDRKWTVAAVRIGLAMVRIGLAIVALAALSLGASSYLLL